MELKETIYKKIDTLQTRLALAMALNVGEATIRWYIKTKHTNLTKAAALNIIKEKTKLPLTQILTETAAVA